jgi:hypothetical protein
MREMQEAQAESDIMAGKRYLEAAYAYAEQGDHDAAIVQYDLALQSSIELEANKDVHYAKALSLRAVGQPEVYGAHGVSCHVHSTPWILPLFVHSMMPLHVHQATKRVQCSVVAIIMCSRLGSMPVGVHSCCWLEALQTCDPVACSSQVPLSLTIAIIILATPL